ncbi:unnamed protein product [Dicrocoelium dendriticum]|nr:unnamed protein product [Dicrocoelium dendriticum]
MSAFEPEFWAFKPDTMDASCRSPTAPIEHDLTIAEPVPFTYGADAYKSSLLAVYESFFMKLDTMMEKAGVDIQEYLNEDGSGQLECPLMPEYGIASADHYFIFKQAAKEIALQHGMGISFMTSPYAAGSSSGCHFNHSLWTSDTGENAFYNDRSECHLEHLAFTY